MTIRINGVEPMLYLSQISENHMFFLTAPFYFDVDHINTNQSSVFENMWCKYTQVQNYALSSKVHSYCELQGI